MTTEPLSPARIDELIADGGKFLRTLSTNSPIMIQMVGLGYTADEHSQGWTLYLAMLGRKDPRPAAQPAMTVSETEQYQALAKVDAYDEPAFRRAGTALKRLFKDQHEYVFGDGLAPAKGTESLHTVARFLDRYAALRDGTDPKRAKKKSQDKAAAAMLEARNIVNPGIEKSLRADIVLAQKLAPAAPAVAPSLSEEELQKTAFEFEEWFEDWRTTASVGITRRDYRIVLGISQRKAPGEPSAPATDGPPTSGDK